MDSTYLEAFKERGAPGFLFLNVPELVEEKKQCWTESVSCESDPMFESQLSFTRLSLVFWTMRFPCRASRWLARAPRSLPSWLANPGSHGALFKLRPPQTKTPLVSSYHVLEMNLTFYQNVWQSVEVKQFYWGSHKGKERQMEVGADETLFSCLFNIHIAKILIKIQH